jgi:hypothetical protein
VIQKPNRLLRVSGRNGTLTATRPSFGRSFEMDPFFGLSFHCGFRYAEYVTTISRAAIGSIRPAFHQLQCILNRTHGGPTKPRRNSSKRAVCRDWELLVVTARFWENFRRHSPRCLS